MFRNSTCWLYSAFDESWQNSMSDTLVMKKVDCGPATTTSTTSTSTTTTTFTTTTPGEGRSVNLGLFTTGRTALAQASWNPGAWV